MNGTQDLMLAISQFRSDSRPAVIATIQSTDPGVVNRPGAIPGGFGDGSIFAALVHVVDVEEGWLQEFLLDASSQDGADPARYRDLPAVAAIWEQVSADWTSFIAGQSDDALWELREFQDGSSAPTWTVAMHTFTHTMHHIAEIWMALTAAGVSPPELELMKWARQHSW